MKNEKKSIAERLKISKKETNAALWKQILDQSKGTDEDKILAGKLILQNYRVVPPEADQLLMKLVDAAQDEAVRKAIALEMVKAKAKIPWRLFSDLLQVLMKDPSPEVRDIANKDFQLIVIEPLTEIAQSFANYQADLVSDLTKTIVEFQQQITEQFSEIAKTFAETTAFLDSPEFKDFEYNWLIFLPIPGMLTLYEMHRAGKDDEVKELLVEWSKGRKYIGEFTQKMKASNLFNTRLGVIQDAIDAHLAGKYSLSVPVFLAQIEGMLWDYAEQQGIAVGTRIVKKDGATIIAHSATPLVKDTEIQDSLSEEVANYFLEKVYTEDFRHGILHGRKIDYNTEENSMNLMLFIKVLLETWH